MNGYKKYSFIFYKIYMALSERRNNMIFSSAKSFILAGSKMVLHILNTPPGAIG